MDERGLNPDGSIAREGALDRVQAAFVPVVEAACAQITQTFGARLHSAYLYGSIPRGTEDRHLPIQIGQTEAFNLSATLTGLEFPRPMSPQFTAGLLHALGGRIRQVRVDRLTPTAGGGTAYCATVEVEGASGVELMDARPSDALNLVALVPAPIFVARQVLADAEARREGDSPRPSCCAGRWRASR